MARKRGHKTVLHICFTDSVFIPLGRNRVAPIFAEDCGSKGFRTVLFNGTKPDELKVEVVVGKGLARCRIKALYIVRTDLSLEGSADCTADVFSYKTSMNFVS